MRVNIVRDEAAEVTRGQIIGCTMGFGLFLGKKPV
jgi:hypothetical protein